MDGSSLSWGMNGWLVSQLSNNNAFYYYLHNPFLTGIIALHCINLPACTHSKGKLPLAHIIAAFVSQSQNRAHHDDEDALQHFLLFSRAIRAIFSDRT